MVRAMSRTRRVAAIVAPVAIGALVLGACSPGGDKESASDSSAGGPSVAAGADESEYAKALADMDPVTIELGGHTTGPGTPNVDAFAAWGKYLEEASGGKIKVKLDYAGAKVSLDKMADGLGQGRIDMGMYIPGYQPDKWPVASLIGQISVYGHPNPVTGRLATLAAQAEFGQTWAPLREEAEKHDIVAVYPQFAPSHDIKLQCIDDDAPESLADLKGKQIRISAPSHQGMAEAIGATPVSLVIGELYQALQRGVVDCAVNSISSHVTGGYSDITHSWTMGTEVAGDWGENPSGWGVSTKLWKKLPLAAQQLIWDSQREMVNGQLKAGFVQMHEAMKVSNDKGMDFGHYDDEVVAKMQAYNADVEKDVAKKLEQQGLADDGQAVIDEYKALHEKWWKIVTEELGYPADTSWETMDTDFKADMSDVDLEPFTDRFLEEVLKINRPA